MPKNEESETVNVPNMRREETPTTRSLFVPLTEHEVVDIAKRMANAQQEVTQVDNDEKEARAQYKAQRERAAAEVSRCSALINAGRELRTINCTRIKDWENGMIRVIRDDTFDVVEERAMSPEERQMEIAAE